MPKQPTGELRARWRQSERESRVMNALHGSRVPVPRTVALCEDAGVKLTTMAALAGTDATMAARARDERERSFFMLNLQ